MSEFLNDGQARYDSARRLFLTATLAIGALFVYQSFVTPPPPPPSEATDGSGEGSGDVAEAEGSTEAAAEGSGEALAEPVEIEAVDALRDVVLATDAHEIRLSNDGARLEHVEILEPERYRPHEDLAGVFPVEDDEHLPLVVRVGGLPDLTSSSRFSIDEDASPILEERDEADLREAVTYRWQAPDGQIVVEKRFTTTDLSYGTRMDVVVINNGDRDRRFDDLAIEVAGSYDPEASGGMFGVGSSQLGGVCGGDFGVERKPAPKVKDDGRHVFPGSVRFAGVAEAYFMTAVIPDADVVSTGCRFDVIDGEHILSGLAVEGFVVPAGGEMTFGFTVFSGPKDERFLREYGAAELTDAVDFGWFSFLAVPIRILLLFWQGLVINWGIAIILLTVTIKLFLFPITQKSFKNMEKMREIQPELQALQKKYENDRMKLAEEQMKLFREAGTSPLGGCLPMVLQMPIYIALYRTIWGSTELYNAPFALWITDLSQKDPYFILPIAMGAIMFIQQRLMPQAVDNPQMKMMQTIMPVMFTAMMLFLPSGLVLYILVNMLLSIAQQLWIRRGMKKPEPAKK